LCSQSGLFPRGSVEMFARCSLPDERQAHGKALPDHLTALIIP
jgi:hypothetical protein